MLGLIQIQLDSSENENVSFEWFDSSTESHIECDEAGFYTCLLTDNHGHTYDLDFDLTSLQSSQTAPAERAHRIIWHDDFLVIYAPSSGLMVYYDVPGKYVSTSNLCAGLQWIEWFGHASGLYFELKDGEYLRFVDSSGLGH